MTLCVRRCWLFTLLFLLCPAPAFSRAAGELLLLDQGARASALAGALTASPESGPFGFVYNPAGLAVQAMPAFGLEHNEWGQEMRGEYLAAVFPLGTGSIAGAVDYFSYGALETADAYGRVSDETLVPYWLGFQSAYGWWVRPHLAVGARLAFFMENIGSFSDQGGGLSLGAYWKSPWEGVGVGLTARNLGVTASGYYLPGQAVLGCSWSDALVERLALFLETGLAWVDPGVELALAAEYQALSWMDIRAGYRRNLSQPETASAGLTAGLGFHWQTWELGYAVAPMGEFGWVHRLSLEYSLKSAGQKTAKPAVPEQSQPASRTAEDMAEQLAGVVKKRFDLGMKQYQSGNYQEAIREWKMVLDIMPGHAEAGDAIKKAERKWRALLDNYRWNARRARMRKDLAEEIKNWRSLLALAPGDQEAQQGLDGARKLVPAVAQTYYNAGLDDYSKGRYQEAIRNWEQVLSLDPEHHKAAENIQKTKEKLIQIE